MQEHIPEVIAGIVLLLFGWAFRAWAGTIKDSTKEILRKLEALAVQFHDHRINTENRVTRVEEKVSKLEQDCD